MVPGEVDERVEVTTEQSPLALLLYTDLMFGVRLQNMARKAGYRVANVRSGTLPAGGSVLIADLSAHIDWEAAIRKARTQDIPVIAFGPHLDVAARRKAKAAGASRVLANSNLTRDLPAILWNLRKDQDLRSAEERGTPE